MPLRAGSSKDDITRNIVELEKAGHPHDQAVAIALHKAHDNALNTRGERALLWGLGKNVKNGFKVWYIYEGSYANIAQAHNFTEAQQIITRKAAQKNDNHIRVWSYTNDSMTYGEFSARLEELK